MNISYCKTKFTALAVILFMLKPFQVLRWAYCQLSASVDYVTDVTPVVAEGAPTRLLEQGMTTVVITVVGIVLVKLAVPTAAPAPLSTCTVL